MNREAQIFYRCVKIFYGRLDIRLKHLLRHPLLLLFLLEPRELQNDVALLLGQEVLEVFDAREELRDAIGEPCALLSTPSLGITF